VIEIIRHGTSFDFLGKWKWCVAFSLALIALGLLAIPVRGLRWGVDFAGGTELQVHFAEGVSADEGRVRSAVASVGVEEPSVVRYGEVGERVEFLIRYSGARGAGADERQGEVVDRVKQALAEQVGAVEVDRVDYVGPKVGADLRRAGLTAMGIGFALILAYVTFRFSWQFAPGGVIALLHDVLVTCSIWILLGQPFDLQVLAALLALVGYSINDTIIIYDRIREMMQVHTAYDLGDVINKSVNATLSRTILTAGLTMLAVIALLLIGGPVIFPFSAVMAIGIVVGTYSSIYIAAPIMLLLERRFGSRAARAGAGRDEGRKPGGKRGADKRTRTARA
jgi:preprotein translocase subunit SecF